jgi:hypothetical protein
MAKKHMKKCSPSLAIKDMEIKTTLRFHLTLVRIAIIKNTIKTGVGKDVDKKEPSYTVHVEKTEPCILLEGMQASSTTLGKKCGGLLKILS